MGRLILREVFSRITILPQLPVVGGVLTGSFFARKRKMVNLNRHNKSGRIISLALVIAMCLAGALCVTGCKKEEPASEPETKQENQEDNNIYGDESLGIDAKVDEQLKDYRHILLLGIDNGDRSDLMIVLSINKKTNEIKSVPVHRDAYMQISPDGTYDIDGVDYEFYKCNRAYKRDGIYGAMMELNRHMDLNIRECIAIDWDGIARFIDSMGGLDADITEDMLPTLNNSLDEKDKIESAGMHRLNGRQAVQYLRVRKYDGGSAPVREDRNQEVLAQLFERAKTMDIEKLTKIYDDVASDLDTNMSRNTLTDTLAMISKSTLESTPGWPYEYTEMWDDAFYYFVPDTLDTNVKELHKTLFGQENYESSETVKMLNEKIETLREEQLH